MLWQKKHASNGKVRVATHVSDKYKTEEKHASNEKVIVATHVSDKCKTERIQKS